MFTTWLHPVTLMAICRNGRIELAKTRLPAFWLGYQWYGIKPLKDMLVLARLRGRDSVYSFPYLR